jgi:hypothetical protein
MSESEVHKHKFVILNEGKDLLLNDLHFRHIAQNL